MFMTEETPVKVMSLMTAALTSMFFLFTVAFSTASFQGVQQAMPDPFAPAKVVAALDNVSNSYAMFVDKYLINPAQSEYAYISDNVNFVAENVSPSLMAFAGVQESSAHMAMAPSGQVAGESTQVVESKLYPSQSTAGIFSVLLGN